MTEERAPYLATLPPIVRHTPIKPHPELPPEAEIALTLDRIPARLASLADEMEVCSRATERARDLFRTLEAEHELATELHAATIGGTAPIAAAAVSAYDATPDFEPFRLDAALWETTPVMTVPRHATFAPLPEGESRHRFLVDAQGLWLECRRPWLHLVYPLTLLPATVMLEHATEPARRVPHVALPFGTLQPKVEVAFGKVPRDFIREFTERARTSVPNERGAWISWLHGVPPGPRLVWSEAVDIVGTSDRLEYPRPITTDTLCPCIDLHSHGAAPAFFSPTDDADDAHDVKIAIVVGSLDQPAPTIAARLCCLGLFLPIVVDAAEVFGGEA